MGNEKKIPSNGVQKVGISKTTKILAGVMAVMAVVSGILLLI